MALIAPLHTAYPTKQTGYRNLNLSCFTPYVQGIWNKNLKQECKKRSSSLTVVAVSGDVSADGTTYLIAGAAAVALVGTAFPIFFSRKDL